jgi:hypothetical protein
MEGASAAGASNAARDRPKPAGICIAAHAATPVRPCPARVVQRAAPGAGLGDGWGVGGGGAGAPGREVGPSCQSPSPRAPPVGVTRCAVGVAVPPWCRTLPARRRPAAGGAGARGAIRVQQAGSPSGGWWSRRRLTTGRSLPYWVEGRGGLPGGRCRGGGHGRGIGLASVRRHACRQSAGRARSPASPPRHARRAPPRAPCAPAAKCVWGSLPRAQSPTHIAVRRLARRAAAAPRWASPRS